MEQDLREQFFAVMSKYKKMEFEWSAECKIPLNELAILKRIVGGCGHGVHDNMNLNVSEIQQSLHITKPAVSYILNALEKKGYITRKIDPKDRRKIAMTATPEGKLAVAHFSQKMDDTWNSVLARFGEGKMQVLVGLLMHLTDICGEVLCEDKGNA